MFLGRGGEVGVVGDRARMAGRALSLTLALSQREREEEKRARRVSGARRGGGKLAFPPSLGWKPGGGFRLEAVGLLHFPLPLGGGQGEGDTISPSKWCTGQHPGRTGRSSNARFRLEAVGPLRFPLLGERRARRVSGARRGGGKLAFPPSLGWKPGGGFRLEAVGLLHFPLPLGGGQGEGDTISPSKWCTGQHPGWAGRSSNARLRD